MRERLGLLIGTVHIVGELEPGVIEPSSVARCSILQAQRVITRTHVIEDQSMTTAAAATAPHIAQTNVLTLKECVLY